MVFATPQLGWISRSAHRAMHSTAEPVKKQVTVDLGRENPTGKVPKYRQIDSIRISTKLIRIQEKHLSETNFILARES